MSNQAFEKVVEPVKSSTQVLENFYRRSFSCLNCPPLGILYVITRLTLGPSDCNFAKWWSLLYILDLVQYVKLVPLNKELTKCPVDQIFLGGKK